jgi:hypothetical protein
MIKQHSADDESPDKPLPSAFTKQYAAKKTGDCQRDARYYVISVEPSQLAKSREIFDCVPIRSVESAADYPADVRPPEPVFNGRMNVAFLVRVFVMTAMMRSPPQRAFLNCHRAEQGEQKLNEAARLESAMGKIAMKPGGQSEHAYGIKPNAQQHRRKTDTYEDDSQACYMH